MKLSQRLLTIASFVKENSFVADIGADHGLLSIYLIENRHAKKVFAVENKVGPFSILEKNTKNYPNITVSLSDGISQIPSDVNVVIIAGMGGILVSDILKKNKDKLKNVEQIIIDAHRDQDLVRKTLVQLGYKIEHEKIVREKVYYNVISFIKGKQELTQNDIEFGYQIKFDPLFHEYKQSLLEHYKKIYHQNNSLELKEKIERLESL